MELSNLNEHVLGGFCVLHMYGMLAFYVDRYSYRMLLLDVRSAAAISERI